MEWFMEWLMNGYHILCSLFVTIVVALAIATLVLYFGIGLHKKKKG